MANPRRVTRWIAVAASAFVGGAVLYPVVGEFFISLAREYGWYDNPGARLGTAMSAVSVITGHALFAWLGGIIVGFTAGLWADYFFRSREGTDPTSAPKQVVSTQVPRSPTPPHRERPENGPDASALIARIRILEAAAEQLKQLSPRIQEYAPAILSMVKPPVPEGMTGRPMREDSVRRFRNHWSRQAGQLSSLYQELFGEQLNLSPDHPNYSKNPFSRVPGDEAITDEWSRQEYRRIYDEQQPVNKKLGEFHTRLQSEIVRINNELKRIAERAR
jgi:hypothetical protein